MKKNLYILISTLTFFFFSCNTARFTQNAFSNITSVNYGCQKSQALILRDSLSIIVLESDVIKGFTSNNDQIVKINNNVSQNFVVKEVGDNFKKHERRITQKELKKAYKRYFLKKKDETKVEGFSIASFVFGVLALATFSLIISGLILGVLAVIFGETALNRIERNKKSGKFITILGLIFGVLGFLLAFIFLMMLL